MVYDFDLSRQTRLRIGGRLSFLIDVVEVWFFGRFEKSNSFRNSPFLAISSYRSGLRISYTNKSVSDRKKEQSKCFSFYCIGLKTTGNWPNTELQFLRLSVYPN